MQVTEAQAVQGGRQLLLGADAVPAEVGYSSPYEGKTPIQEISRLLGDCRFTLTRIFEKCLRPGNSLPEYGDARLVSRAALEGCRLFSSPDAAVPLAGASMGR